MSYIFVDCEAYGGSPATGRLTEIGAVVYPTRETFYRLLESEADEKQAFEDFEVWVASHNVGHPVFVSDNPAFDWQWINVGFWKHLGHNPFGHSARR